jgi:type I restriction enzyme S subunit
MDSSRHSRAGGNPVSALITDNIDVWTSAIKKRNTTGRGSSKKIELTGVKKLRELILELAVSGKLVQQDPTNEPASVLLEKIAIEKAQLIANKKIKKQKALSAITLEEKLFELPIGWKWCRLQDSIDVRDGTHDSPKDAISGETFPLVTSKDFKNGEINFESARRISAEDHFEISKRSLVEVGDILFSMIGGNIGNQVIVKDNREFSIKNVALFKYYDKNATVPSYFKIYTENLASVLQESAKGGAQPFISLGALRTLVFALPPLAEQHRIVTKVDELMALCDQLEQQTEQSLSAHQTLVEVLLAALTNCDSADDFQTSWQRIADHFDVLFTTEASIDQLKQTILQLAVMGKLVPQNPSDEPASVLLEKIAEEKAQLIADKKIKTQKPLPSITDEEKPFELPSSWEWCNLSELFAVVTDGDHQAPPKASSGVPFLVIGNLNTGRVVLDGCRFVPETYYEKLDWSRKPTKGDLLYTVTGSYGIPIKVTSIDEFCVQRHVAILKASISSPIQYLNYLFQSKYSYEYATEVATGIAQKTVPLTGLRKMPAALPPVAEQHRIVAKVDELMALCEQLKARLSDAQTTQLHLADAVVENALAEQVIS